MFDIKLCALYEGPNETRNECEALIASITVDNLILQLANLMIRNNSKLNNIYDKIKETINPDDMSLVFIDLSDTEGMIFSLLPNIFLYVKILNFTPGVTAILAGVYYLFPSSFIYLKTIFTIPTYITNERLTNIDYKHKYFSG